MDYKARFYSPYINHFIQPDSIIPDPSNPQAWNRFGYVRNNPINFNDPTGHIDCALYGFCPDSHGVDYAISIMKQVGNDDILVAAGIAVQSQWIDWPFHNSSSGIGPAQISVSQLSTPYGKKVNGTEQYGLGIPSDYPYGPHGNPNTPAVAAEGMSRRIYQVVDACTYCSAQDKVIVAALAQNNGFTIASLKDLRGNYYNSGAINWSGYLDTRAKNYNGGALMDFRAQQSGQGKGSFDARFMLLLYTNDLLELDRRGWDLPYGLTTSDIYAIRRKYLYGKPSNPGMQMK